MNDIEQVKANFHRVTARMIASAHLLDIPFTDSPDLSPWKLLKYDLAKLRASIDELEKGKK